MSFTEKIIRLETHSGLFHSELIQAVKKEVRF